MIDVLEKFVKDCKSNIPGFIAISVCELNSGTTFISDSIDPNFDPTLASAYESEIVKAELGVIKALKLRDDEHISDIIITLTDQIHLIDISKNNAYFVYLVVDSKKSNLGVTRALLTKYENEDLRNFSL